MSTPARAICSHETDSRTHRFYYNTPTKLQLTEEKLLACTVPPESNSRAYRVASRTITAPKSLFRHQLAQSSGLLADGWQPHTTFATLAGISTPLTVERAGEATTLTLPETGHNIDLTLN